MKYVHEANNNNSIVCFTYNLTHLQVHLYKVTLLNTKQQKRSILVFMTQLTYKTPEAVAIRS